MVGWRKKCDRQDGFLHGPQGICTRGLFFLPLTHPLLTGKVIYIQASGLEELLVGGEGLICLLGVFFCLFCFTFLSPDVNYPFWQVNGNSCMYLVFSVTYAIISKKHISFWGER